MEYLDASKQVQGSTTTIHCKIDGIVICREFFRCAYSISREKLTKLIEHTINKTSIIQIPRQQSSTPTMQSILCQWLEKYILEVGEQMPHKDEIHLPIGLSWKSIFDEMEEDKILSRKCSFSWFSRIVNSSFPNVKILANVSMGKCTICTDAKELKLKLRQERARQTKEMQLRAMKVFEQEKIHLDYQSAERQQYTDQRHLAKNWSQSNLSLIIDGMSPSFFLHIVPY